MSWQIQQHIIRTMHKLGHVYKMWKGHIANSKECKIWHNENEITKTIHRRNILSTEAKKIVETQRVDFAQIYTSTAKDDGYIVNLSMPKQRNG